jgi:hypothetical protein
VHARAPPEEKMPYICERITFDSCIDDCLGGLGTGLLNSMIDVMEEVLTELAKPIFLLQSIMDALNGLKSKLLSDISALIGKINILDDLIAALSALEPCQACGNLNPLIPMLENRKDAFSDAISAAQDRLAIIDDQITLTADLLGNMECQSDNAGLMKERAEYVRDGPPPQPPGPACPS